jgi:predicted transcriptional regulator
MGRVTKRAAISLPDDLFRDIERARKRSKKDRSTWLQDAASEYLKKRTKEEDEEAWLSADERMPMTEDERSFIEFGTKELGRFFREADRQAAKAKK